MAKTKISPKKSTQTGLELRATGPETVPVLLPLGLPAAYDYLVPQGETVEPGQFVVVPLGPSEYIGAVWRREEGAEPPKIATKKLREIVEILHDVPKLPPVSLDFADWVANYTLALPGMVLRMMMSAKAAFQPPAPRYGVRLVGEPPERMTPARARVMEAAASGLVWVNRRANRLDHFLSQCSFDKALAYIEEGDTGH